jgi:BirA family biotin operon repressor/biotin-[acetyl-CoA-carboxylase] ligase
MTLPFFKHIKTTNSTMDVARELATDFLTDVTLQKKPMVLGGVLSDEQLDGRGRREKTWLSPKGGFYSTYVVRIPEQCLVNISQLSFVACLSVGKAIYALDSSFNLTYKWPNDIFHGEGKLAGILIEGIDAGVVAIGIGINLKPVPMTKIDQKVSFFSQGKSFFTTPQELYAKIQSYLQEYLTLWFDKGFCVIRRAWLKQSYDKGVLVEIIDNKTKFYGTYEGIDAEGFLLVRMNDQKLYTVSSGDVSFRILKT